MTTDELRAKFDPNPLASGPTKWRAENCTTHHYACDCREWEHACQVERLEAEIEALRRDAERYRWLRGNSEMEDEELLARFHIFNGCDPDSLDGDIDAAMAKDSGE